MTHPNFCYSNDLNNNCIIIKWGEAGYYKTDYPEGGYTDEVINEMNANRDITPEMREAMVCCSMATSNNPNLDWDKHYEMVLKMEMERR